ncbi:unnamed protein product [Allacma fusca]|uniref:Nucleoporin NDC1 n=1 Tax=Allacma fusca TaxID=39272 RepID=A0A8J2KLN2_9HEXA|nr:unnamed protein product [Allacma fusca]
MQAAMDPTTDNTPNILMDRVLTGVVFCMIIHYGLFYSLQLLLDFYHIFFRFDFPQLGFWRLILHPFQFVFTTVFSLGWIYLCVAVGLLTWIYYRRLQWIKTYKRKRDWNARFSNFSYGVAYHFIGLLLASTYLRFMYRRNYEYVSSGVSEAPTENNVDERYSFVLQSCGIASVYFYANFLSSYDYLMKFPLVETSALLRLRGVVLPTLKESARLSAQVLPLSYFVNFISGETFHTLVSIFTTGRFSSPERAKLASVSDYFDIELLFVLFLCQLLVTFTMKSLWLTMEAIITKRMKFRIGEEVPGVSSIGLREMMISQNVYLKKLAYYDLKLLTEYDEHRMLALFTLSHPGGFPKIWNTVRKACLDQIHKLTNDLRAYMDTADSERKKKEAASIENLSHGLSRPRANFVSSPTEGAGVKLRSRFGVTSMRNLHLQNGDGMKHIEEESNGFYAEFFGNPFSPVVNLIKLANELGSKYALKLLSVLNLLKYFKDSTETDMVSLFADQETTVWAVSALTDVVVASTKIDSKGVVQPDICLVLTSLIELCSALDDFRALKDGNRAEMFPAGGSDIKVLAPRSNVKTLVQEVRKPLKNEVMRIHLKFHSFYDIINISPSCEQKLRQLVYYD